jgi:hypothetical protein
MCCSEVSLPMLGILFLYPPRCRCYVGCYETVGIGRRELRGATATDALQYPWYCSRRERGRGPAARAVRGAGNAGRQERRFFLLIS